MTAIASVAKPAGYIPSVRLLFGSRRAHDQAHGTNGIMPCFAADLARRRRVGAGSKPISPTKFTSLLSFNNLHDNIVASGATLGWRSFAARWSAFELIAASYRNVPTLLAADVRVRVTNGGKTCSIA